jgi:hypothetical protein
MFFLCKALQAVFQQPKSTSTSNANNHPKEIIDQKHPLQEYNFRLRLYAFRRRGIQAQHFLLLLNMGGKSERRDQRRPPPRQQTDFWIFNIISNIKYMRLLIISSFTKLKYFATIDIQYCPYIKINSNLTFQL